MCSSTSRCFPDVFLFTLIPAAKNASSLLMEENSHKRSQRGTSDVFLSVKDRVSGVADPPSGDWSHSCDLVL